MHDMPVIEAQRASILVPHDHRHISHECTSAAHTVDGQISQICADCERLCRPSVAAHKAVI